MINGSVKYRNTRSKNRVYHLCRKVTIEKIRVSSQFGCELQKEIVDPNKVKSLNGEECQRKFIRIQKDSHDLPHHDNS